MEGKRKQCGEEEDGVACADTSALPLRHWHYCLQADPVMAGEPGGNAICLLPGFSELPDEGNRQRLQWEHRKMLKAPDRLNASLQRRDDGEQTDSGLGAVEVGHKSGVSRTTQASTPGGRRGWKAPPGTMPEETPGDHAGRKRLGYAGGNAWDHAWRKRLGPLEKRREPHRRRGKHLGPHRRKRLGPRQAPGTTAGLPGTMEGKRLGPRQRNAWDYAGETPGIAPEEAPGTMPEEACLGPRGESAWDHAGGLQGATQRNAWDRAGGNTWGISEERSRQVRIRQHRPRRREKLACLTISRDRFRVWLYRRRETGAPLPESAQTDT